MLRSLRANGITEQPFLSTYRPSSLPDCADRAVSSSAVNSSNALPSRSSPAWSRKAISWSSGEPIIEAGFGQPDPGPGRPILAPAVRALAHPRARSAGNSASIPAEPPKIKLWVAASQTLLVVTVVETNPYEGGRGRAVSSLACCMRIIAQWTFRVWDAGGGGLSGLLEIRLIGRARHADCLIGSFWPSNSTFLGHRIVAADLTGNALTIHPGIPSQPLRAIPVCVLNVTAKFRSALRQISGLHWAEVPPD